MPNPSTLTAGGVTYTLSDRDRAAGRRLVVVDVDRLDAAWRRDAGFHVGPGGVGPSAKPGAYANAARFLGQAGRGGAAVEAPTVDIDRAGAVSLGDGRHRLAALRDSGARTVVVSVTRGQAPRFARLFAPAAAPAAPSMPAALLPRPRPAALPEPPPAAALGPWNLRAVLARGRAALTAALDAERLKLAFARGPLDRARSARVVQRLITATAARLTPVAEALARGVATVAGWYTSALDLLLPAHAAATMARTGTASPPPPLARAIADQSNRQAGFLARFRDQLSSGTHAADGAARARLESYAAATWAVAENARLAWYLDSGRDGEARRVLGGSSHHCGTCLDAADDGWVPIGEVLPIGDSECGGRCTCSIDIR